MSSDLEPVDITRGMSPVDARLAREVFKDHAAGLTTNESAERLGIYPEKAWLLLSEVQAALRTASVADHRDTMVEMLVLAEQTLMGIMRTTHWKTGSTGYVVRRQVGEAVNEDGETVPVYEDVEDSGPRIQAATALSLVVSRHSKLIGADVAPPELPPSQVGYVGSIEDQVAALAAELGLSDGAP